MMNHVFNQYPRLNGKHSFLSPSKYHWINYDVDKLTRVYSNALAAMQGSALHEFAHRAILLGIKLPRNKRTLNQYVNDALGFRMIPEQMLYYSDNCFGTADCISYKEIPESGIMMLRIHDLKTGETRTSVHQLEVYAAIFCLEYDVNPEDIVMEFRIYQNDDVQIFDGDPVDVRAIMNKIVMFDRHIESMRAEALQ